MMQLKSLILS